MEAERTSVENGGDDLRIGVKGQSNPEISRSPRNSFRASVARSPPEVEHRMDEGLRRLPNPTELRMPAAQSAAVRACGLSCVLERETARTAR